MGAGYGSGLAEVHHVGFGHIAREAAPFVLGLLGPGAPGRLVVDLGCGTGVLARALTDAGYGVLGVDLSEDMLRPARQTAPAARFVRASPLDAEVPACACVTAVGEAVNYAFDERAGPAALRRLFARVQRALEPGGVFVFDSAGPGRAGPGGRRAGGRRPTGWCGRRPPGTGPGSAATSRCSGATARCGGAPTSGTCSGCTRRRASPRGSRTRGSA